MQIAFISDIHGNFTALQSVLEDIQKQNVDQVVCLGDTVSLGPQPVEVLNALRELNSINIKGNHDEAILRPELAAEFEITEHLVPDLHWGREHLTEDDFAFLKSFKNTHTLVFPNSVELLAFHGSPRATTDIIQAITPPDMLDAYFQPYTASIFIGGHSHIQMHRRHGKILVLNSGSVGNAFEFAYSPGRVPRLLPWAEYAILRQSGAMLEVEMRRVGFDTDALLDQVRRSGLPGAAWWLRQYQTN